MSSSKSKRSHNVRGAPEGTDSGRGDRRTTPVEQAAVGGHVVSALRRIIHYPYTLRDIDGNRIGIGVRTRRNPHKLNRLRVRDTLSKRQAEFAAWVADNELDPLLNLGANPVADALRRLAVGNDRVVVDATGYHRIVVGGVPLAAYAWSGRLYWLGKAPSIKVLTIEDAAQVVPSQGDWCEWIQSVEPIAKRNPRLLAVLCVGLSAALIRVFGMSSFTLALFAPTSMGKSTMLLLCMSMLGVPKVLQWNGTKIGLQELIAANPDRPFCLDDMHRADRPDDAVQLVMATGNASGRIVSRRATGIPAPQVINSSPIISTEKPLASMIRGTAAAGMFARYFEVGQGRFGMFDDLCGCEDGAALARHIKQVAESHFGTLWPSWLRALSASWPPSW